MGNIVPQVNINLSITALPAHHMIVHPVSMKQNITLEKLDVRGQETKLLVIREQKQKGVVFHRQMKIRTNIMSSPGIDMTQGADINDIQKM